MVKKSISPESNLNQKAQVIHHQSWEGPLPPPVTLEHYEKVAPGAAERILRMAEKEQDNRHKLDQSNKEILEKNLISTRIEVQRGQYLGTLSIIACIISALFSIYLGAHWSVSIAFVSVPLVSAIKAVITRKGGNSSN